MCMANTPTRHDEDCDMSKRIALFAATGALSAVGVAYAQFPILDVMADLVVQKY